MIQFSLHGNLQIDQVGAKWEQDPTLKLNATLQATLLTTETINCSQLLRPKRGTSIRLSNNCLVIFKFFF